jgi:hypothetical protein
LVGGALPGGYVYPSPGVKYGRTVGNKSGGNGLHIHQEKSRQLNILEKYQHYHRTNLSHQICYQQDLHT